jgi:hypothetical protein
MAVTYTTAALVKKRIEYIDASLLDADIEQYIYEAEGIINSVMKDSFISGFDATKHALIRSCATDLAAYDCLKFDPSNFPTMETAEMVANLLWNSIQSALAQLADPRIVTYLKSL